MKLTTTGDLSGAAPRSLSRQPNASEQGEAFRTLLDAYDAVGERDAGAEIPAPEQAGDAPADDDAAADAESARAEDDEGDPNAERRAGEPEVELEANQSRDAGVAGEPARVAAETSAAVSVDREVRHAASVDLASIHADQLTKPVEKSELTRPGETGSRPTPQHSATGSEGQRSASRPGAVSTKGDAAPAQPVPVDDGAAQVTAQAGARAATPAAGDRGRESGRAAATGNGVQAAEATNQAAGRATPLAGVLPSAAAARAGVSAGTPTTTVGRVEGASAARLEAKPAKPAQTLRQQRVPQEQQQVVQQAQRGLASVLRQGGGTLSLKLTPEALGTVRVEMQVSHGVASASLRAETTQARELLSANLDALRSALEDRGLRVERLSVEPTEELAARIGIDRDGARTPLSSRAEQGESSRGDGSPGERADAGDADANNSRGGGGGRSAEPDRGAWEHAEADDVAQRGDEPLTPGNGAAVEPSLERDGDGVVIRLDAVA